MLIRAQCMPPASETILVGYAGRDVDLAPGMRVHALHPLRRAGERSSKLAFLAASAVRMGMLWFELTAALIRERPHVVLVQNPPGFPAILSAWIAARWSWARLLVDWHNYSFQHAGFAFRVGSRGGAGHADGMKAGRGVARMRASASRMRCAPIWRSVGESRPARCTIVRWCSQRVRLIETAS